MHTRAEIETAILALPTDDQSALREWFLQKIPKPTPTSKLLDRSLDDILPRFQDMVRHLNIQWQMYDDLFRAEHYPILNKSASTFFYQLRWYLFDGLISSIARFLDPPRNRHQEILSLERVCLTSEFARQEFASLKTNLLQQLGEMRQIAKPALTFWRNKIISHADLKTLLREIDIPPLRVDLVRDLVARISAFASQLILFHTKVGHEFHVDTGWYWVPRLIEDLKAGIAQRQARGIE